MEGGKGSHKHFCVRCYCCSFCFFVVGDRTNALIECEDEAADDGGAVVECEAFPCFPKKTSACAGGRFKPGDAGRFRGVFVFVACGGS